MDWSCVDYCDVFVWTSILTVYPFTAEHPLVILFFVNSFFKTLCKTKICRLVHCGPQWFLLTRILDCFSIQHALLKQFYATIQAQINSICDSQTLNGLLASTAVHGKWNWPEISFVREASENLSTWHTKQSVSLLLSLVEVSYNNITAFFVQTGQHLSSIHDSLPKANRQTNKHNYLLLHNKD